MKKLMLFIFIVLVTCSCSQQTQQKTNEQIVTKSSAEVSLLSQLKLKFGEPLKVEKYSAISNIYKWESSEEEIGKKFKYEIDKFLDVLPYESNTDLQGSTIIDKYRWETPKIFVEFTYAFYSSNDKTIHSSLNVRIDNK